MVESKIKKERGVTLIELMIVLVIAAILVGGIYTLFMTQQRSYSVQDQVAGAQQDARAALNIVARDIRMSGAVIGAGDASGFTDGTAYLPTVGGYYFSVNSVVNNDNDPSNNRMDGTDAIAIVFAEKELGLITNDPPTSTNPLQLDHSFDCPTFVTTETQTGKVFRVNSCPFGYELILNNFPASGLIKNEKVFAVSAVEYRVGKSTTSPSFFVLRRTVNADDQPLIGDDNFPIVEDLQIAYQLEGSNDWIYDQAGDTWPVGKTAADIRMVRINITVRTAIQDATVQDAAPTARFNQPEVEDHTTNLNGPDGFRRRVYTTVVKLRNL